jgi:fatty-acyl-CoA synthase
LTDRLVVSTVCGVAVLTHPSTQRRSVLDLLDARALTTPDAPAVSFPAGEHTYAELAASTRQWSRRLRAAGVEPGDRVGILLKEGSATYLALALGAMRIGALVVAVNARNKVRELEYVISHSGMRLLATEPAFAELLAQVDHEARVVVLGEETLDEADVAPVEVDRNSRALLLYTSGTTATPKGCLLTHAALLAVGENCAERMEATSDDRFWTPLPLFHVGGWQAFMTMLSRGGCFSHAGTFEATAALDQLEREKVTMAFPAFELIWMSILDHPRFPDADLSALRIVQNVGVPERLQAMQARVPQAVQVSCFGSTESGGSICLGSAEDSLHSRTHTSGKPMPGVELKVVDEAGNELGPGQPGELLHRAVSQFDGYSRDPETTARAVDEDGWFRTGDQMCWEEDGSIRFIGRLKDMLKVGGENVSAADIEDYLLSHPAVAVAAVIGAPDSRYGEVPAAYVRLAPGAQVTERELIQYCDGQIAGYKVPRYVRFVDEFPVTPTAKIQKFVLRDRIADELRAAGITEAPRFR